jgi:hypothetical protein
MKANQTEMREDTSQKLEYNTYFQNGNINYNFNVRAK